MARFVLDEQSTSLRSNADVSASASQSSVKPADQTGESDGVESESAPVSNVASGGTRDIGVESGNAANETSATQAPNERNNLISRTVNELYELLARAHEPRENVLARGVTFHVLNSLVELSLRNQTEERDKMMETALAASRAAHGPSAITAEALAKDVETIMICEKELTHVRHMAKQQGLHMAALNHLTQLMRLNSGDRGQMAINTLVAYADAAGIKLDKVQGILAKYEDEATSVLPVIAPDPVPSRRQRLMLMTRDVVVGLVLTAAVMWAVL